MMPSCVFEFHVALVHVKYLGTLTTSLNYVTKIAHLFSLTVYYHVFSHVAETDTRSIRLLPLIPTTTLLPE
jgi:hypothetical protein